MIRDDLLNVPHSPLPEGFELRTFHDGDIDLWTDIEASVREFPDQVKARDHFEQEFGARLGEVKERCLFLEDASGNGVATAMAWHNPAYYGKDYGRIHWVAVRPEFQGKGLGKVVLSAALERLGWGRERAYLTTQTTSWVAIHMYLNFGFLPVLTHREEEEGWELLRSLHPHPALKGPYRRLEPQDDCSPGTQPG